MTVRPKVPTLGGVMLVRFGSIQTESLIMCGDSAVQLIKMMGASGSVPGAIAAEDISAAVTRLRQQLQLPAAVKPPPVPTRDDADQASHELPVELVTRAAPLLELLERVAAGHTALMWEAQ